MATSDQKYLDQSLFTSAKFTSKGPITPVIIVDPNTGLATTGGSTDTAVGEAFDTDFVALEAGGGDLTAYTELGGGGNFFLFAGEGLDVRAPTSLSWGMQLQYTPYISNANGVSWNCTFKVKNTQTACRGVGFGFQSVNTVGGRKKSIHWFMTQQSSAPGLILLYKDEQTASLQTSNTSIPVNVNDEFLMEVLFDGDVLLIQYTNLTTGNFEKTTLTHKFTFSLDTDWNGTTDSPKMLINPSEGRRLKVTTGNGTTVYDRHGVALSYAVDDYLVYENGGWDNKGDNWTMLTPNTYTPTIYGVKTNSAPTRVAFVSRSTFTRVMTKNPKLLFIGDSITKGYWSSNFENTFVEIIRGRVSNIDIVNYSQPSARTDSFDSPSIDEVIEINPTHVIYLAGSNDIANGDTSADIYGHVSTQIAALEAAEVTVHYVALFPRTGQLVKAYNDYVITQLPGAVQPDNYLDLYYPFLDPSVANGLLPEYSDDGTHLNAEGSRLASDIILKYMLDKGIIPALNRG